MTKKDKYNFLIFSFILIISFYLLIEKANLLGFFADDISIITGINQLTNFKDIVLLNKTFDAGRDLQLLWMKIFINISTLKSLEAIHYLQVFLYFINSIMFIYILKLIQIENTNIIFAYLFFLFFPLNSEVIFWSHNLPMTLISTSFFLIFLIINLKIFFLDFKRDLILDFLSIMIMLFSIFTYEQAIFSFFFIIIIRTILSKKFKNFKYNIIIFIIYSFITVYFSYYKIKQMKELSLNSGVLELELILQNILSSIKSPISINFTNNFVNLNLFILICVLIIFFCTLFLYFLNKNNYKNEGKDKLWINKKNLYILLICLLLYFASLSTIFIHHISPRHFYLPSIFIGISLSIFFSFCLRRNKNIYLIFSAIFFIVITNNISNVMYKKKSQINNYKMKQIFYQQLKKSISENEEIIKIKNFPNYHNKGIFFAHEQSRSLQFLLNDNKLPLISNNLNENGKVVEFLGIEKSEIKYKITSN